MFTGIIEEIGVVKKIEQGAKSVALTIAATKVLEDTKLGDSIATNGICLTVTKIHPEGFTVDVMYETLKRSSIGTLRLGSKVNLERALTLQTRLGGHMVSGHIDDVGTITAMRKEDIATLIQVRIRKDLMKYLVEKGSVTIDGISLTLVEIGVDSFVVSVIPHTKTETTLLDKRVGDLVNIECDLIGKYVESMMRYGSNTLTLDKIKEYGF